MSGLRIRYATRGDASPRAEKAALSAVYRLALDAQRKKAADHSGGENVEKGLEDESRRNPILPR